ncbi:thiamine pyrophosphate-dependent enzyme [Neobacillus mesonae]|uniref:Acetolactate synthase n=1 Tax=Neobacillus mesonae TaxID=1193713 RepID=A0A3Q9QWW8_9BACI|nr:thiamine pyrophosphate-dependent enzyme [Neobacillus mesonae]AZU62353.1 acetolactate synthase [Neobacillus mesonae]
MTKRITVADAIVKYMEMEEISHVFCVPGESYLPLMDSIYSSSNMKLISTRHEGGAAFMAESYGKATRKPGVAMATRGVGGSNLAIGIHTAFQDSTPMVVFLGQVHSKFRGREGFQEIDLDQFFGHIAKWTVELKDPERTPELIQRAFRIAQSGRPGPVVVSLPEDVLKEEIDVSFGPPVAIPAPRPIPEDIQKFQELLEKAERPLIVAGGGVIASNGEGLLVEFAEKLDIPVIASFRRHDVFPNNHRLYAGHAGLGIFPSVLKTMKEADVVIAIGTRLSEVTTQDYMYPTAQQKLIQIDIDYDTIGKVNNPEIGIVADAASALKELLTINLFGKWEVWTAERRKAYEQDLYKETDEADEWINMRNVIRTLKELLPDDSIITNDAGNFAGWLHSFYSFNLPKTYIGPTSGAMGYGLPAAIGAKVAHPDKVVVSLSGDGGFMMTVQELETAARCGIPVIALIFNNSMYGTIRMHQEIHYPERVIGTELNNVDFAKMGEALGVKAMKVKTNDEFTKALENALAMNGPVVIEVITNPEQISLNSTISSIREKNRQHH